MSSCKYSVLLVFAFAYVSLVAAKVMQSQGFLLRLTFGQKGIICGAVVVNKCTVITLASCVKFHIHIGLEDYNGRFPAISINTLINFTDFIAHPKYSKKKKDFNVGILKYKGDFFNNIKPAELPKTVGLPEIETELYVNGFVFEYQELRKAQILNNGKGFVVNKYKSLTKSQFMCIKINEEEQKQKGIPIYRAVEGDDEKEDKELVLGLVYKTKDKFSNVVPAINFGNKDIKKFLEKHLWCGFSL